jgi:hypothetical protein
MQADSRIRGGSDVASDAQNVVIINAEEWYPNALNRSDEFYQQLLGTATTFYLELGENEFIFAPLPERKHVDAVPIRKVYGPCSVRGTHSDYHVTFEVTFEGAAVADGVIAIEGFRRTE